jgi:hypothetical protein
VGNVGRCVGVGGGGGLIASFVHFRTRQQDTAGDRRVGGGGTDSHPAHLSAGSTNW